MTRVLVIYASNHGQTGKIAVRIVEALESRQVAATLENVKDGNDPDPADFDAVIVAASIHRGQHQNEMIEWVTQHLETLSSRPNAFLSVSLSAADDTDEARSDVQLCIDRFLEATGWKPDQCEPVAGAIQYLEYDFFTRTTIRMLMKAQGHPTDTKKDHDFTDWDRVSALGEELAERFSG